MTRTKLLLSGLVSASIFFVSIYAFNIYKNKNNNISNYTNNVFKDDANLLNCNDNHDFLKIRIVDDKSIMINGVLSKIERMMDVESKAVKPSICGIDNLSNGKLIETGQYYFYMNKQDGYLYITDIVNKATKDSLGGAWKIKLS
ncbi:UNVERIFIED_ORG: hypothetical protein M2414_004159 [Rahnella aquatilis]